MRFYHHSARGGIALVAVCLLMGCNNSSQPAAQRGTSSETSDDAQSSDDASMPEPTKTVVIPSAETTDATSNSGSSGAADLGPEVTLPSIVLTAPEGWKRKLPSSSFVEAEFTLPAAEGDKADGRLTVSVAGGSVEANVERWKGQFGGNPEEAKQEEVDLDGIKATLVDFTGEFDDRRGPFAPGEKRADYRMIAAIIPVDGKLHFIKATGPKNTLAKYADSIDEFIHSLKKR